VLGVSGGVDSATVLGLLVEASRQPSSPIKVVYPLIMPIYGDGTSGQFEATQLAKKQCEAFKVGYVFHDLSDAFQSYVGSQKWGHPCRQELNSVSPWANGQLASILRTPCSYYHAALLQAEGFKSLVVGTTNRDEGSYIGFYGKASDAMVDLQPIADIHKSEVYEIAKIIGVIPEIIERTPRGDVWDAKTDEEMIGAPYWFLEMYLLVKEYSLQPLIGEFDRDDHLTYMKYANVIEKLHQKNFHKYQVGMPSHFIDFMPRSVPDGWK